MAKDGELSGVCLLKGPGCRAEGWVSQSITNVISNCLASPRSCCKQCLNTYGINVLSSLEYEPSQATNNYGVHFFVCDKAGGG